MTYLSKIEHLLQEEHDAMDDFKTMVNALLSKGYTWKQLCEHLLSFPEIEIKAPEL